MPVSIDGTPPPPRMGDWIECGKTWGEIRDTEIGKPGVQIEAADVPAGESTRFLIGDINECGGVCDCCHTIFRDTIILRYRVIVTKEEING